MIKDTKQMKFKINQSYLFRNNLLKYLLILASFSINFNHLQLRPQELRNNELNIDYLDKLPEQNYIIGPGDLLSIVVARGGFFDYDLNLSSEEKRRLTTFIEREIPYLVSSEGTINMNRLNRIYVSGLSIKELINLLNKKYKKFVKTPNVEISILKYRPLRIYINGEIANPGMYVLGENSNQTFGENTISQEEIQLAAIQRPRDYQTVLPTIFDAIKESGGITNYSDLSKVELIRKETKSNGGGTKKTTINFLEVINNGNLDLNITLSDQDIINIPRSEELLISNVSKAIKSNLNPKYLNVVVSGRVNSPGIMRLSKLSTLSDAIMVAGGTKTLKGKILFTRVDGEGEVDIRKIGSFRGKRGTYRNPYLRNGDIIYVGNNILSNTSEVLGEIALPLLGINQIESLLKDL